MQSNPLSLRFDKFPVAILLIALLAAISFSRNALWQEEVTIWQDTVQQSPNKARPNYELGLAYDRVKRPDLAFRYFAIVRSIDPDIIAKWVDTDAAPVGGATPHAAGAADATHQLMLVTATIEQGDYDRAFNMLGSILTAEPDNTEAYVTLARIQSHFNRTDDELEAYRMAITRGREVAPKELAYINQGIIFGKRGRYRESVASFQAALRIKPSYAGHYNLAVTYANMGLREESARENAAAQRLKH